ncbi:hypothetical protein KPL70_026079 [Citrus sinensis]|nr:hypothetical protein KPL70_026079 [Citrus sinensis]
MRTLNDSTFKEGQSTTRPPFFDGNDYAYWKTRMRIYLRGLDYEIWEVVCDGLFMPMFQDEVGDDIPKPSSQWMNTLGALGKTFSNSEKVKKIIRSLLKEWRPKRTAIEEAKDLNTLPLDDLIGSLISYEEDLAAEKGHGEKKKNIALKALKYDSDGESEPDDEELAMLARSHIKSECPLINKLKKKAMVATWDDSDEDSSDEEGSQEVLNLALMAIGGDDDLNENDYRGVLEPSTLLRVVPVPLGLPLKTSRASIFPMTPLLSDFVTNSWANRHWKEALSIEELIYENLVRVFYSNMELSSNHRVELYTYVGGIRIAFNESELCSILGISYRGLDIYTSRKELDFSDFHHVDGVRNICRRRELSDDVCSLSFKSQLLPFQVRILHIILQHMVTPGQGHTDEVTRLDVGLLDSFICRRHDELPDFRLGARPRVPRKAAAALAAPAAASAAAAAS